jgi:hypothetical protein
MDFPRYVGSLQVIASFAKFLSLSNGGGLLCVLSIIFLLTISIVFVTFSALLPSLRVRCMGDCY